MSSDLSELIDTCARFYRLGREAEAATELQKVITQLTAQMESDPQVFTARVKHSVARSFAYQQSQDWIGLADELQFVLKPELEHQLN